MMHRTRKGVLTEERMTSPAGESVFCAHRERRARRYLLRIYPVDRMMANIPRGRRISMNLCIELKKNVPMRPSSSLTNRSSQTDHSLLKIDSISRRNFTVSSRLSYPASSNRSSRRRRRAASARFRGRDRWGNTRPRSSSAPGGGFRRPWSPLSVQDVPRPQLLFCRGYDVPGEIPGRSCRFAAQSHRGNSTDAQLQSDQVGRPDKGRVAAALVGDDAVFMEASGRV